MVCVLLVDYCDVFISCLDSHSDGTHSLQRIHWWASDAMLHFSKWRNKVIYILNVPSKLSKFSFWVNYSFKRKSDFSVMPSSHCTIFKLVGLPLFSHCMTIWGRSQSLLFSHCTMDATGGFTLHDFTIGRIADNCLIRKYSQTHARSVKDITQDHADIMVYKSSRNTQ